MHAGIANPRWRGKRSRHSRCMRNPQFYLSGKRPIQDDTCIALHTSTICILSCSSEYIFELQEITSLTHLTPDKMAAISQTTCSNIFSWMKISEFQIEYYWNMFLGVSLTTWKHWFKSWLGAVQATNQYLNQCWPSSSTHMCGTGAEELNKWSWRHYMCPFYSCSCLIV